ncbi:hypothetical protein [Pseudacidovorax intermedius]|mgnify:CR=1 FL=1|uniref:hypothetical protein n=1 Tax=Pseudacidovorax intermedius TaxID=433924 RepID=UPI0026F10417|nr:hypothetical protein [Pseudacidovorax intermedius]
MLEIKKEMVLLELQRHVGRENGIHVRDLVSRITGQLVNGEPLERKVRELVAELRRDGHKVCAHPADGYFIAADHTELMATCRFLLERANSTTGIVAELLNRPAPDLYAQLGVTPPERPAR